MRCHLTNRGGLRAAARCAAASGLVVVLLVPGVAAAQTAPPKARDGMSLDDQPAATKASFQAAYGANAAAQWQREHNVLIRTDLPQAADGLTLQSQPSAVQTAFISAYGAQGPAKWAVIHSGAIGRAVILTGDLGEAVEATETGELAVAQREFKEFSEAWENDFENVIRPKSDAIATAVGDQIRAVSAVLITPAAPVQARYLDELQELADVVKEQQAKLAAMPAGAPVVVNLAPTAPVAAAPAAAPAAGPPAPGKLSLTIDTGELESSITGGLSNNLTRARGELEEFFEAWDPVKAQVQKENPTAYTEITADLDAANAVLGNRSATPEATAYLPLLQKALATIKKYQ
jgi:hypothetical protein